MGPCYLGVYKWLLDCNILVLVIFPLIFNCLTLFFAAVLLYFMVLNSINLFWLWNEPGLFKAELWFWWFKILIQPSVLPLVC